MSFSINTNVASLQAQTYLNQSSNFQGKTINKVTSGLRIVQSGDDAAGLAVANGFRSDEAVLTQGVRNANDGLSQLQIADGGLSNISQLIDRARTLATQSASGTFSGDRGVLNSEFKSVIGEIDRQAQSIGLNTNGSFAKSLSVFVGGGKGSSSTDLSGQISNGSVGVDLSTSTVDSKSLGLKGVQAIGTAGTDIGTGSDATSVSQILANTNNTNSELTSGYTTFSFRGPGFGDSSRINVAVNLSGVTDTGTLVTAINSAISSAGNSGSQAATAFKNANITAGVNIDTNGKAQLTFNSSAAAFQVEAGDKTANALLGNFKSGSAPEGADIKTTVTGAGVTAAGATTFGTTGAGTIDFRFSGASLTTPQDVTFTTSASDTVATKITQLQSLVANNSALKAAGITLTSVTPGAALQFTSTSGEKFQVDVSGDLTNKLGFGSFQAGNLSQFDYSTLTAATGYTAASASGTSTFEFSINGQASDTTGAAATKVAVSLSGGDATAATVTGTTQAGGTVTAIAAGTNDALDFNVNGTDFQVTLTAATTSLSAIANQINTVISAQGTATINGNNQLVITSNTKGAGGSVQINAGNGNTNLGLTTSTTPTLGTSRSGSDFADALNQAFSNSTVLQSAGLKADFGVTSAGKLTVTSTNGSDFRLNTYGSGATASTSSGTVSGPFAVVAGTNDALSISVDGGTAQTFTLTAGAARTAAQIVTDLSGLTGATASVDSGGHVKIVSSTTGASSSVTFNAVTHDASATLGLGSSTGQDANAGFGVLGSTFAGNAASAAPTNSAQVDAGGASQSTALAFTPILYGSDKQTITIAANDTSGSSQSISIALQNGTVSGTRVTTGASIDQALNTINSALQQSNNTTLNQIAAVKDNSAGTEQIKFISTLGSFKVSVGSNANVTGLGASAPGTNVQQGSTINSNLALGGSTADISSQASAANAVSALSTAVSTLGKAQAVVGRGENQLTYATNLAQSQLTNLATAESRIRDADLSSEAANLTKAQVLIQAGVAALAQANSAPQQVLSLLRG